MASMFKTRLERLQETIRNLPTDGTVIERCHEEVPDYQMQENLPVNSEDKPLLIDFDKELSMFKNETNHLALLKQCLQFCRYRSPPTPNADEDSAHGISLSGILQKPSEAERFEVWVVKLHTEEENLIAPKTESHLRNMIRQYGDLMGENGRPAHIENIASVSARESDATNDPTPNRSDIHYWDESIVPILESPNVHLRDKTLIAVAWDSGARPSELYPMKASNLTDRGDYLLFEIEDSKTDDRTPHLHVSMPYLRKWLLKLDEMTKDVDLPTSPLSLPPEQPIWTKQKAPEQLASSTFGDIGRKVGERLSYHRPTNLRQFRKSRASIIASKGNINEAILRARFGWEPSSSAPAHYIARFNDEANQQIANIDGAPIEIAEEHEEPSPFKCSSCERWSPRHLDNCFWCGSEMTGEEQTREQEIDRMSKTVKTNQAVKSDFKDRLNNVELSGRSMELALDVVKAMESDPELTRESIGFALMTEYDISPERVMGWVTEDGDDDLGTILE